MNTNFGKLTNGVLTYAPTPIQPATDITVDGVTIPAGSQLSTDRADVMLQLGYLPIVNADPPTQEGYHAEQSWAESATQITQTWTLVADTAPQPTDAERIADLELSLCDIDETNEATHAGYETALCDMDELLNGGTV
jgi:hypothetical protein